MTILKLGNWEGKLRACTKSSVISGKAAKLSHVLNYAADNILQWGENTSCKLQKNEYIYLLKLIQLQKYGFKLTWSINGLQLLAL